MAIMEMKHLTLAVIRQQKQKLLEELVQHGCVEVSELSPTEDDCPAADLLKSEKSKLASYRQKHQSLQNSIELLNRYIPEKKKLLSPKPEMEASAFLDDTGLDDAVQMAQAIEQQDDQLKKISADQLRLNSLIESLQPWKDTDIPLECTGTGYAELQWGTLPAAINPDEVDEAIAQASDEAQMYRIGKDKALQYVALICLRGDVPQVLDAMRPYGYMQWTVPGLTGTAQENIDRSVEAIEELDQAKENCSKEITAYNRYRDNLKLAADKMSVKVAMAEAEERLLGTDSCVFMEGWAPVVKEEDLEKVFSGYDCAYELREPEEEETDAVPILLTNNPVTDGLNMVTNMYSLPKYATVDPNPLMAPFFILFYGLMMADIGYGLIMVAAALVALKKIKPREGMLSMCRLLLWCGIATIICGAMTGSFFSDIPYQLAHLINPNSTWEGLPCLFSPTKDSNMVLYGSMILGAIQLNTGMVISFVEKCKAGNVADALWYEGTLWLILITGILAIFGIGFIGSVPVLLIIAIVLLLIGQGRGKKGIGKLTAALAAIYNEATGWFGDVLSYARIMALMLAGGVVGQVFNTVAVMPAKSSGINVVTILAFILIFLFGHAMNFALNILGCYVHDLRLQCLEYFKKFYEAGGKPFRPLKISGKYINVEET